MQLLNPVNFTPPGSTVDSNGFDLTWDGPVSGNGQLDKRGAGTLTLTNGYSSHTGTFNVYDGTLRLAGAAALRSTGFVAFPGAAVAIDDSGVTAPAPNRLSRALQIALSGGTFTLTGSGNTPVTESLGGLLLGLPGGAVEVVAAGGQTAAVRFMGSNLSASDAYDHRGGTVEFRGTNLGAAGGPGVSVGRVFINGFAVDTPVPGATARDLTSGTAEQAFYDVTNGVGVRPARPTGANADFVAVAEIRNPANGGTTATTANVRVGSGTVPTGGMPNTIQSLRLAPGAAVNVTGGALNLASGVVWVEAGASPAQVTGGTLAAGAAPLRVTAGAPTTIASALGGTGGFVKDGPADLTVSGSFGTTGGVYVHGGTLAFTGPVATVGAVTTTGGTLTASGAALTGGALPAAVLNYNGGATAVPLRFGNTANATVAQFNVNGAVAGGFVLSGSAVTSTLAQSSDPPVASTALGPIGGGAAGATLAFTGPADNSGVFVLGSGSTFTAGVSLTNGTLAVSAGPAFGAAANVVSFSNTNSATPTGLRFDASLSTSRTFSLATTSTTRFNVVDAGTTVTLNASLAGRGSIIKDGAGTLVVNGANSFSGVVAINSGRVLVNGSTQSPGGGWTVGSGATLGGTGLIWGPTVVQPGGTLAPGASPGILSIPSGVTMTPGSVFAVQLSGATAGTGYSQLNVPVGSGGASVNLNGATLSTSLGFDPTGSSPLTIITVNSVSGTVNGTFANAPAGQPFLVGTFGGTPFTATVTYAATTVQLSNFQPVPEPTGLLLLCGGAAGVVYRLRRR
jgi:fibronectin-binding autotransporter adhesin